MQIIVPMPSFDSQTKKPWAKTPKEKEKVSVYFVDPDRLILFMVDAAGPLIAFNDTHFIEHVCILYLYLCFNAVE